MKSYYNELVELKKDSLKNFNKSLIPNLDKEIIGVSNIKIKELSKKIIQKKDYEFLNNLPHLFYEEDILHGYLLSYNVYTYQELIELIEKFLPYVSNWAVCDTMAKNRKVLLKEYEQYFHKCLEWINTNKTYYIRFGLLQMMSYYLNTNYVDKIIKIILTIKNHDYYVDMMISWLLATMMIEFEDKVISLLKEKQLNDFIIRKTISKSIESYRISNDTKEYLKELRKLLFNK